MNTYALSHLAEFASSLKVLWTLKPKRLDVLNEPSAGAVVLPARCGSIDWPSRPWCVKIALSDVLPLV